MDSVASFGRVVMCVQFLFAATNFLDGAKNHGEKGVGKFLNAVGGCFEVDRTWRFVCVLLFVFAVSRMSE